MTAILAREADQIEAAALALKTSKPDYSVLIDFYTRIFKAQEDSKKQTRVTPPTLTPELVALKAREKFPLIGLADFDIDHEQATALCIQICRIASVDHAQMAPSAQSFVQALEAGKTDLRELCLRLLQGDDAYFDATATQLNLARDALAFIVYSAMRPSLVACAEGLATHLAADKEWGKGYCPVCGSPPGLSFFGDNGERFFHCSFCWHAWPTRRIFCPFCENTDGQTQHYFFSESEKGYRVDVCGRCNKYVKTVDLRELDRVVYPPLEQVASLHLDLMAGEKGLESGLTLDLQV